MKPASLPALLLGILFLAPACRADPETRVELLLGSVSASQGEEAWAGLEFRLKEGWHIYWRNGGDAGTPPRIEWDLPEGIRAGPILWPLPEKYETEGIYSYIYSQDVVLPFAISADAPPGEYPIRGQVDWLECETLCVPRSAQVEAVLRVGEPGAPAPERARIESWLERVPQPGLAGELRAGWTGPAEEDRRRFEILPSKQDPPWTLADFLPHPHSSYSVEGGTDRSEGGGLVKSVYRYEGGWPEEILGVVLLEEGGSARAVEASLLLEPDLLEPSPGGAAPPGEGEAAAPPGWGFLLQMALYAFLGGIILNFMPCVLPVISLKILGFVQHAGDPGRVRRLGWLYALGVLCTFMVLAALVLAVRETGRQASWGMQFQNLQFLVFMMLLVLLVALNFFGVYEIGARGGLAGLLGRFAGGRGQWGAFSNGVLATFLATPCTAPFLAVSLGFALAQPPLVIVLMFAAIAAGLALPYVLLSSNPRLLGLLPRPGPWMAQFRTAMGFPMLATALWLYSVALAHFPPESGAPLWMGMLMVLAAASAWIWGQFVQGRSGRRLLPAGLALLIGAGGGLWVLEGELAWRDGPREAGAEAVREKGILWHPWDRDAVARARSEGHPALVDFTADWCYNCLVNKRTSIAIDPVRRKLEETGTLAFRADNTLFDPEIAEELRRRGRAGVPMVLVYPAGLEAEPRILPEILTPGTVLEALEWAAGGG